ncbi:hypothetical protein U8607_01360 [Methylobacterium durans]|uniref:hypothetical protein n=1 Tax=Methylobacterium durans TaxID=2202825 RepID=UPI002AFF2CD2|nr:hypothetical protein [Methylobacterium durans]MEA1830719.1 hypothetical protein [Methylobacterium durans]
MPVFDAKNLDSSFEGQALLTALLHPTRAEQARARINGRRRAVRAATMADPMAIEPRFPVRSDDLAATPVPTT